MQYTPYIIHQPAHHTPLSQHTISPLHLCAIMSLHHTPHTSTPCTIHYTLYTIDTSTPLHHVHTKFVELPLLSISIHIFTYSPCPYQSSRGLSCYIYFYTTSLFHHIYIKLAKVYNTTLHHTPCVITS